MNTMRLIVKFKMDSGQNIEDLIEDIEKAKPMLKLVRPPRKSGRAVFNVASGEDAKAIAAELGKNKKIAYAEVEGRERALN